MPHSLLPTATTTNQLSTPATTKPNNPPRTVSPCPPHTAPDPTRAAHNITGRQLLSFGAGYVESENTKRVGGPARAVASDEANNGSGQVDEWKRKLLLDVGADVVIPDYRDAVAFVDHILAR